MSIVRPIPFMKPKVAAPPPSGYLYEQNFTSGAQPAGWSVFGSPTVDWGFEGNTAVRIEGTGGGEGIALDLEDAAVNVGSRNRIYLYYVYEIASDSGFYQGPLVQGIPKAEAPSNSGGRFRHRNYNQTSAPPSGAGNWDMFTDTTYRGPDVPYTYGVEYHGWLEWSSSIDPPAEMHFAQATTATKPGWNVDQTSTSGGPIDALYFYGVGTSIFRRLIVHDSPIGDNP